jgi:hypothetical protein
VTIRLERLEVQVADRPTGVSEDELFFAEIARFGMGEDDLDRPLTGRFDAIRVIEIVAVAEAVWKVELGPRSGSVSEVGELAYEWPTLRALVDSAKAAPKR